MIKLLLLVAAILLVMRFVKRPGDQGPPRTISDKDRDAPLNRDVEDATWEDLS